jgi:hypothetical protein
MRYVDINSQDDLEGFLNKVDSFHDSILKEVAIVARGYVDATLQMYGDIEPFDVRCIIQQQSDESPYIDIVFESVTSVLLTSSFPLEPCGLVTEDNIKFFFSGSKNASIVAEKMKYRILGMSLLGNRVTAVNEIACGKGEEAIALDDSWYQCPDCLDAFEFHGNKEYFRCKSCGKLLYCSK